MGVSMERIGGKEGILPERSEWFRSTTIIGNMPGSPRCAASDGLIVLPRGCFEAKTAECSKAYGKIRLIMAGINEQGRPGEPKGELVRGQEFYARRQGCLFILF